MFCYTGRMKILFFGDVVGRNAREKLTARLPVMRRSLAADAVIVNADNAAGGFGVTPEICREFFKAGADVITGGDHIWDQKTIPPYIAQEKRLLRPHNFPPQVPGSGFYLLEIGDRKLVVLHLLGQVFHRENLDCPFAAADRALEAYIPGRTVDAVFVDFHAEATSEKCAMGHYLDGRVSAVVGSHTHIPTDDARILKGGTAYQTDAGMCGDYDSVIGFKAAEPLERFLKKTHKIRMEPASGHAVLRGLLVETDDKTGMATAVTVIRE